MTEQKPWNVPVDITKPDASEKIKQLGSEAQSIRFNEDLAQMTDKEFKDFYHEITLALYHEEIRRFGKYQPPKPNMSNNY